MKFKLIALLFAAMLSSLAVAQSSPGFVYGQVPTAAQWNSYFSAKMDYAAGGIPIASGGTGATTASAARTNLGIGTVGIYPIGTSGVAVPLLSTANTWSLQQTYSIATGTAPFSVASTTRVANLNAATCGTADTATTVAANATLTSPAIAKQTLPVTSTAAWDLSVANMGTATLVTNISTLTIINLPAAGSAAFYLKQTSAGSYTIAWPTNVYWSGGTAPTLTTTTGHQDMVTCNIFDGTNLICAATLDVHH